VEDKERARIRDKLWRERNRERLRAYYREYNKRRPEIKLRASRKYHETHRAQEREYQRRWRKKTLRRSKNSLRGLINKLGTRFYPFTPMEDDLAVTAVVNHKSSFND
jgi:hypothetical protein